MLNVVRVRAGEEIVLFDGSGREARARLLGTKRRAAEVQIMNISTVDREPERKLTIGLRTPPLSAMRRAIRREANRHAVLDAVES